MNRFLVLAVLAVLAVSACATTGVDRQPQPLAATGDSPIAFGALGAKYEVPQRLKITDHDKKPGMVWFDFIDNNNGCVGAVVFYASSDRNRPLTYVTSATETDKQEFKSKGIDLALEPVSHQPMLGEKALVQVATLSTKTEKAAKAHFGVFVPEQQLAVVGNVFCDDPGFIEPQLEVLSQVVNSQVVNAKQQERASR